jgi:AcrR family transcriptional regulator
VHQELSATTRTSSEEIVGEIRRQIEAGELRPGERIPSTREITRRWGVAMATATKVLAELQRAGLVRAIPGSGTVVERRTQASPQKPTTPKPAAPRPHPATRESVGLTVERIVTTAIAVADSEGIGGLSMRRLATELGIAPMSLYRHVADKEDLLLAMIDRVAGASAFPEVPPDATRTRLECAARMLWDTFRRHPWMASALSLTRPQPVPSAVPLTEWMLASLERSGLDLQTRFTAVLSVIGYVRGMGLNIEMEVEAEAATGLDSEQWTEGQSAALESILAGGRLPQLERLVAEGYDFDLDAVFEFGLQRLLDGIELLVERGER